MYLLTVRFRCFPPEHAPTWHQHLTDHFFNIAEDRMIIMHQLNSRMIRNKFLKDLFIQWRGLTAAYDQGFIEGDAVLATAIWRNICKADENVDVQKLAEIVSYMRSVLASFDAMDDEVIASGDIIFSDPSGEEGLVKIRSRQLEVDHKLQKEPAKPLTVKS
jgi:cytochrome b pre-mRNA-processing protein 3